MQIVDTSPTGRVMTLLEELVDDVNTTTLEQLFRGVNLDPNNRRRLERWGAFFLTDFLERVAEEDSEAFTDFEHLSVIDTRGYNSLSMLYDLYTHVLRKP